MKPQAENWLEIARYDLKTANECFKSGLYLKVFENCHSSLEKLMKGIIAEQSSEPPPKIHDLLKLVSLALIRNVDEDIKKVLDELNDVYISTRYPDDIKDLISELTKERTQKILERVKEIQKWLMKQIK